MAVGSRGPNRIHATHLAKMDRIRKEFWSSYRPRQEIAAYREQIVADQKRAEKVNELRRLEGHIASMQRGPRLKYLEGERSKIWASFNVANSDGLL